MTEWERTKQPESEAPRLELASEPHSPLTENTSPSRYSPQPSGESDGSAVGDEPPLLDYVRVLYKRRWTAATSFLVVFLWVVVYTFTAAPIYEARVRLLIEAENPNVLNFQQVVDEGQARSDYYQTQYDLLQSRSLARRTLDSQHLWGLVGGPPETSLSIRRAIAGAFSWAASLFQSDSAQSAASDEMAEQSATIDALLADLRVSPVRNSRVVDLSFRSRDPRLAAAVVNAHARNYIEQNLEFRFLATKEATDWLGERLAEQRQNVKESETALQRYRERNDAISLEDRQNIVVLKLTDLNAAVTRAKTERIEKEALYSQLRSVQNDRAALDTFPAILTNTFIQQQKAELAALQRQQAQLGDKLGDRHPEMIRTHSAIQATEARLQGEIAKVVQSVRNQFLAAKVQEDSLVTALEAQKRDALGLNRKGIEYGVLQRDVDSNRQIYESLLQRAKETGVSGELKTSNIRVVDAAETPRAPVRPRKRLNLLLALFGGGFFAAGMAWAVEYLNNRIKTPEEITVHLGLPFLGMIPEIAYQKSDQGGPVLNNGVPSNFAEAFRTLRTSVLFCIAEEGSRSVVVTSSGPAEGKTLVSCNLAIALAQAGLRVLLIDADLRRPAVHQVFAQKPEPGLSNLLVGDANAGDSIRRTAVPGLWTLPAGRLPPNPSELLGSRRFKDSLASFAGHFDWVVIDSPPVMAVTDASVTAHLATGVLFVIGSEMASRRTAKAAIHQLDSARARFLGAVLNRVDLEGNSYYYSAYYKREYVDYYTQRASG